MSLSWYNPAEDESEFGPGAALVLSLFAMLLLVAALGWRDARAELGALPTTLASIAEGNSGQGFFDVGRATLRADAKVTIAAVARQAVLTARVQRQRGGRFGANHLQVIGYASPEGRGNQILAERRALAVRDYLVHDLHIPEECVIVASYADSHSRLLQRWLQQGNTHAAFRALGSVEEQRRALGVSSSDLQEERNVTILGVFHSDSTCRLDQVTLTEAAPERSDTAGAGAR